MNLNNQRRQFLLRFAYQGQLFPGVQEQPGLPTVLSALRKRIEIASEDKAHALFVAARTDRGVHALENYATFYIKNIVDISLFSKKLTAHQDDGLYALLVAPVSSKVHARGQARSKIYRYYIKDKIASSNPINNFRWEIAPKLNIESMRAAARYLIGLHDFSSLRGGGCQAGTPFKEIFFIDINRSASGVIAIEIHGDGFLRKMIRNMVGLLAEIGAGLRLPESTPKILAKKDRNAAGIMAPASGLFLAKINFEIAIEEYISA
jgi:tRNA pseudouridine38-40 synthase